MINRIYENLLSEHFNQYRQMAFLSGPRQVGKTTSSRSLPKKHVYINWDNQIDRLNITNGADKIAEIIGVDNLVNKNSRIIFDEIHKYAKWKNFIKGFYDKYGDDVRILVTGSARLNIYKRGGDSLMGRYFPYRMHPLSIAEILTSSISKSEIRMPQKPDQSLFEQLLRFGGFPEPFIKNDNRFYNRWRRTRQDLFFKEDLRDMTNIQEIGQIEVLAELLQYLVGQLVNYTYLAKNINVSVDTIRRWITALENLYFCFIVRPYFKNIPKSLRKQPKIYLWDWSLIKDTGAKHENFIASHLLKAVHFWTDAGIGEFELFYLRDKLKREVDFLVTKNKNPWFLVEVKSFESKKISSNLEYYSELLNINNALQVNMKAPFVDQDCFNIKKPTIVPATTMLSQLV